MKSQTVKEQESDSDWDSMSEMEPPPKIIDQAKTSRSHPEGQGAAVPRKLKSLTYVDADNGKGGEKPPFDFKSEAPANTREEMPSVPGKSRKGNIYSPNDTKQRRVSFAEGPASLKGNYEINGSKTGGDTDSEDPMYATVNHKTSNLKKTSLSMDSEDHSCENVDRGGGRRKMFSRENSGKSLQGVENKGFVDDEESSVPVIKSSKLSLLRSKKGKLPELIQGQGDLQGVQESTLAPSEKETVLVSRNDTRNDKVYSGDGLQPLILSLGQTSIESAGKKPIDTMNKAISEACTFVTFPVFFFSLLLHHFIKFFLQGLVKPLIVDSLVLVVEYFIKPCTGLVVKPTLFSLHGASSAFSDIVLVCLKPVIAILQSLRLVEINYTRKYSIEEV